MKLKYKPGENSFFFEKLNIDLTFLNKDSPFAAI